MLTNIDLISEKPQLFFKGQSRNGNVLGGILTAGLILTSLVAFGYFSNRILKRLEPNVNSSRFFNSNSSYQLNTSETVFAFKVVDRVGKIYEDEEKLVHVYATLWDYYLEEDPITRKQVKKHTVHPLNISKCPDDYKLDSAIYERLYKKVDLNGKYHCLDPGQLINITNQFATVGPYSYINVYYDVRK